MPFSPQTTEIRLNNLEGQKTMTKAQHTPGPWFIGFGGREQDDYAVICSKHSDRAICNLEPRDYNQANARLIASAPDLLAALQMLIDTAVFAQFNWHKMSAHHKNMNSLRIEKARAAIAKATGE